MLATVQATAERLRGSLASLPPSDREFATSLLSSLGRYGRLTPKQEPWLYKLAQRAQAAQEPAPAAPANQIDTEPLRKLFATAGRLKFPALHVTLAGVACRVWLGTDRSRTPGALMVAADGGYGSAFYGRVQLNGAWEPNRDAPPAGMLEDLLRFAADPVPMLVEQGRITGRCCFCSLTLTTEESVSAGYGPVCAGNWGLPWGKAN